MLCKRNTCTLFITIYFYSFGFSLSFRYSMIPISLYVRAAPQLQA